MPVIKQILVDSHCSTAFSNCSQVLLCLTEDFEEKTICGFALAHAKVVGVGFKCAPEVECCPALPEGSELYTTPPLNGEFTCVYTVEVDREAEFLIDPGTNPAEPYDITSDDVVSMVPYPCVYDQLIEAIKAIPPQETDVLEPYGSSPLGNGHRHTSVEGVIQDILLISTLSENLLTYNAGLYIDCDAIEACGFVIGDTDSLSEYNTDVAGGHRHTAVDGDVTDIHILSQTANNLVTYDDGIYLDCAAVAACGFVIGDTDTLSEYNTDVAGGHRHTAVDGDVTDIHILSQAGGNLAEYNNGIYIDCDSISSCVPYKTCTDVRACFSAGDCISISAGAISVDTSGVWGQGSLAAFPANCQDDGMEIYCDSSGELRTEPPIRANQVSGFVSGARGVPTADMNGEAFVFINVVNPSDCRPGWVSGAYTGAFQYEAPSASAGGPNFFIGLDGVLPVFAGTMIGSTVGGSTIIGHYLVQDTIDDNQAPIAAGGSSNFSIRIDVLMNGGSVFAFSLALRLTVISV